MTPRNLADLVLLAAIWGGSFLFMRMGAPSFGPLPLIELRVGTAALFLLPILFWKGLLPHLKRNAGRLLLLGALNSGLPFVCWAFALLTMSAGMASVLNATTPLFTALVATLWLRDRLTVFQIAGLLVGFFGVILLVWSKGSFSSGAGILAVAASLGATLCYGVGVNLAKKHLAGVDPLVLSGGSMLGSALLLLPAAVWTWPAVTPPAGAWISALLLGVVCSGMAYVLFYRLVDTVGPSKTVAVTYLIPIFGMLWGAVFLGEKVTPGMLGGAAVILLGTALTTGLLAPRKDRRP